MDCFFPPLGSPTSFMKGIRWFISLNSNGLKSFSSGGMLSNVNPFAHDCVGIFPFFNALWQVLHTQDFPCVLTTVQELRILSMGLVDKYFSRFI
jgi:hypothetical protein